MATNAIPMRPPNAIWSWPKKFQPKNEFRVKNKLQNECDFDYEVRRLKLKDAAINVVIGSTALRYWAMRNANRRYVPTVLLDAWGIVVSCDV